MAQYNVSKAESKKLGIPRVKISGGGGSSSSSSSGSIKSGKFDYSPDTKNLAKLQEKYISSLKPTGEETMTQDQLNNLIQSRDLGIQQTSQRAIESPLIRGESAAKMRTAQIQSQPLINKLSQIQAARQAQNQAYSSMMGFEQSNLDRAFQVAQEKARQQQIQWQNDMAQKQWDAQQAKARAAASGSGFGTGVGGGVDWDLGPSQPAKTGGGYSAANDPVFQEMMRLNQDIINKTQQYQPAKYTGTSTF